MKLVEWFEDGRTELYDLKTDPGETNDIAKRDSSETARLRDMLARWRVSVDASMPMVNPDWEGR